MAETGPDRFPDGWFRGADPDDPASAADVVREGRAERPKDWPAAAVAAGIATDEPEYYGKLRRAAIAATRQSVDAAGQAGDRQLVHAVRALDDMGRKLTYSPNPITQ